MAKRVAIVGSGCSGIGALWALKSTPHEVHLYEAGDRLGGHTNTVTFTRENHETKVDTGFIVMNSATYRQLSIRLLKRCMLICRSKFHCLLERDWRNNQRYRNDFRRL